MSLSEIDHGKELQNAPGQHEQMPDCMAERALLHIEDHAERVCNATAQQECERRRTHPGDDRLQHRQTEPPHHQIERQ